MIANHIHDALGQVRKMQEIILQRRSFRGYSGRARMAGAGVALVGTVFMSSAEFPETEQAHLLGWMIVLGLALVLNYGALAFWFLFNPRVKRNLAMLIPAVDAVPSLAMGALMSAGLVFRGVFDLLFGTWMIFYGLAHGSYRQSLPQANYAVGAFYMVCGVVCFVWPGIKFTNPVPMGIVFFVGELAGGWILFQNNAQREAEDRKIELMQQEGDGL